MSALLLALLLIVAPLLVAVLIWLGPRGNDDDEL